MLGAIQNEMFDLGADLATPGEDFDPDRNEPAHRRSRRSTGWSVRSTA